MPVPAEPLISWSNRLSGQEVRFHPEPERHTFTPDRLIAHEHHRDFRGRSLRFTRQSHDA
jgi:hypothetical protein